MKIFVKQGLIERQFLKESIQTQNLSFEISYQFGILDEQRQGHPECWQ